MSNTATKATTVTSNQMPTPSSLPSSSSSSWRLTHEQIQDIFIRHDVNQSASIDISELSEAMKRLGLPFTESGVRKLFDEIGKNHKSYIIT
jgi:Ca2+-binding EF-hand superfamily protein